MRMQTDVIIIGGRIIVAGDNAEKMKQRSNSSNVIRKIAHIISDMKNARMFIKNTEIHSTVIASF